MNHFYYDDDHSKTIVQTVVRFELDNCKAKVIDFVSKPKMHETNTLSDQQRLQPRRVLQHSHEILQDHQPAR